MSVSESSIRGLESVGTIATAVAQKQRPAGEVVQAALEAISQHNEEFNAFREVWSDAAMRRADEIDARIARGEQVGPLAGVPIAIKDNIATQHGITACGSRILEDYSSPYDATVVLRIESAGAVIIGKTNCDEFAMGSSNEHCAFGVVKNPCDPTHVPGGSSGGSAVAVASGMCPVALGSETGGSIRQPASFCGLVGVKPSYGRVSRYGLVAYGSSLDQIGPFATSVCDAAMLLQTIAGHDPLDSTSSPVEVPDYLAQLDEPVENLRIGVPREFLGRHNDPAVDGIVRDAIATFERLGIDLVEVELPRTEYAIATYYILATAEASSNLARYDGIRYGRRAETRSDDDLFALYARSRSEGFGSEVQRRIMLGTYVLSAGYYDAYYKRALQVRRLIKQDFDRAFEKCHALIGPVAPTPAFPIGEKSDPMSMYLCDVYTTMANVAGICGISVPAGYSSIGESRLPVGLHIQCPAYAEQTMFRIARQFEAAATVSPEQVS